MPTPLSGLPSRRDGRDSGPPSRHKPTWSRAQSSDQIIHLGIAKVPVVHRLIRFHESGQEGVHLGSSRKAPLGHQSTGHLFRQPQFQDHLQELRSDLGSIIGQPGDSSSRRVDNGSLFLHEQLRLQKEVAERLGVSPSLVSKWEKGERKPDDGQFWELMKITLKSRWKESPDSFGGSFHSNTRTSFSANAFRSSE
ncbi:MAG: helix-turn-helix domain-containing protein [Proteobacteria bacterium]|nr:helix-turn-helix domain-containing protein [Pseudomonadota bacterium]